VRARDINRLIGSSRQAPVGARIGARPAYLRIARQGTTIAAIECAVEPPASGG